MHSCGEKGNGIKIGQSETFIVIVTKLRKQRFEWGGVFPNFYMTNFGKHIFLPPKVVFGHMYTHATPHKCSSA